MQEVVAIRLITVVEGLVANQGSRRLCMPLPPLGKCAFGMKCKFDHPQLRNTIVSRSDNSRKADGCASSGFKPDSSVRSRFRLKFWRPGY